MKKKETQKYVKFTQWCLDECWRIQEKLYITNYRISIDKQPKIDEDKEMIFEITNNYPYQTALLGWQEKTFTDWQKNPKTTIRNLLHEMIHILVEPLARVAENRYVTKEQVADEGERLVDFLTNVLIWGIEKK